MTTPTILTDDELAECKRIGEDVDSAMQHAALLGARKALSVFADWHITNTYMPHLSVTEFRDTRYPLPVREVPRTVRTSNDMDWQIRDGKLWYRLCLPESEWRKHLSPTSESIAQLARDGRYADAALLCGLAANPTTLDPNGGA